MTKSKLRVLVIVNPNASRAQTALPALSSWFTENCKALIVVAKSKKERMRELKANGKEVDLIVIGGGDGTISTAVPQLLELERRSPYCRSELLMISHEPSACRLIR